MGTQGALVKTNPARAERDGNIAADRIAGATYHELAERYGVSTSTIHRVLTDDDIKDVITEGTRQAVSLVPQAIANYRKLLDDDDSKIRHGASKDVLTLTGIMPSHAQSIVISNSFNKQSIEFTPEVIALLAQANQGSAGVIDLGLDSTNTYSASKDADTRSIDNPTGVGGNTIDNVDDSEDVK